MNQFLKNSQNLEFWEAIEFVESPEIIQLHDASIERFGGLAGVRDRGLLESAVHQPFMIAQFGSEEERTISSIAAAYFFHIIKNHPFLDGNKRAGLLTTTEFLSRNGYSLEMTYDDLYQLAIDTASSQIDKPEIARILGQFLTDAIS